MIRPNYKIELYKIIDEEEVSTIPVDVTGVLSIQTTTGIETRKDTFSITFDNYKIGGSWKRVGGKTNIPDNLFRAGDNIKIFFWTGSVEPSNLDNNLLMDGEVTAYGYSISEKELSFSVKGVNRTESLLSTLVPTSHTKTGSNNTSPLIIKEILSRVKKFNPRKKLSFQLTGSVNNDTGSNGYIQETDSNGNPFDAIAYHQNYKSAYEQIEELSRPEYTGDDVAGNYIFYIRYSPATAGGYVNEFVWKSKNLTAVGSIKEGEDFGLYSIDYSIKDVVNAMIVSVGEDCYGHGKTTYVTNFESMGKYGAKWKFYPATNIIPDLIKREKNLGDLAGSTFDERFIPDILDTGSWEFNFNVRVSETGEDTGTPVVVGNDKEYNDALREEGKWLGQEEGQKIVDLLGSPRYRFSGQLLKPSIKEYNLGDLYHVKAESYGWDGTVLNPSKQLRLIQEDYLMNLEGITVNITLEEDEKTVGVK